MRPPDFLYPVLVLAQGLFGVCEGDGVDLPGDQVEAGFLGHGARIPDGPVDCQALLLG